jgi:phosphoenolpyruvate carboxykinase (ATP)
MNRELNRLELIEAALSLGLGKFSNSGALVVETGKHTGRAVNERFVARDADVEAEVDWGTTNKPIERAFADEFFQKMETLLGKNKTYKGHSFIATFPIEVTTTSPWHLLFAKNMFRDNPIHSLKETVKSNRHIQILHAPYHKLSDLGLRRDSETMILMDFANARVGIIGTQYAGEMKKSAFGMCNYMLPEFGIFPMHASANCTQDGKNSSVLFGLSGTGKTSLSADPERALIGDDEIIWTESGLSNLEGGCYAKLIDLAMEKEPEIFKAVNRFGAIQENVVMNEIRDVDFYDKTKTENTRGSYPISFLSRVFDQTREAEHPKSVVFLTADAFGALPAVARLTPDQAQFHFLSGYTAKVAGTELGVKEPTAAFSACFGAPFMPRCPTVYAKMLAEKIKRHGSSVWLLNTGWFGGAYGVGSRFPIAVSRTLLTAIQNGSLNRAPMRKHPVFGFEVPESVPGVDPIYLGIPSGINVESLGGRFVDNFKKFAHKVDSSVLARGGLNA